MTMATRQEQFRMKALLRGVAVMLTTGVLAAVAGVPAVAQDTVALDTERARASYMVGHDIGRSIAAAAPDIDLAAFDRAVANALQGGEPLIEDGQVPITGRALRRRIADRAGQRPATAEENGRTQ